MTWGPRLPTLVQACFSVVYRVWLACMSLSSFVRDVVLLPVLMLPVLMAVRGQMLSIADLCSLRILRFPVLGSLVSSLEQHT